MRASRGCLIGASVLLACVAHLCAGEIHEAITNGDVDRVASLLKRNGALVNTPDENDQFLSLPLHLAARHGHVEIARLLLEAGAEADCGDSDESTPLGVAALNRHGEMVAFLIENGADVNMRDRHGAYALSFAASGGDSAIVEQILRAGADLNYLHDQGFTLFHMACSRNLTSLFDLLVERGYDINSATPGGVTPLHWAAHRAPAAMIEAMLAYGADPAAADEHGDTPLTNAAYRNNVEAAAMLLRTGVDPNAPNDFGDTPLHQVAWRGHGEFVRLLLENGADANAKNEEGATPLTYALRSGDPDVVEALLGAGANPNAGESRFRWSVLHMAAIMGYGDVAEALLGHGASLESTDDAGDTPLDHAIRYGHGDVAELLIGYGAAGKIPKTFDGSLAAQGNLAQGEAVVWYLGHSGWAIKTKDHLLVFDYFNRERDPAQPGLCNGHINTQEMVDERTTVFVSHEHSDHFDPAIFSWHDELPNLTYVMGCHAEDAPAYEFMEGRARRSIDGMKVTTIESNDTGVGFMIEVDGLVVYHAGDHANRHQDFSGPYTAEIDYLASQGFQPDIAFMPISGCGFGDQVAVKMGVEYALEALKPTVFIPMHSGGNPYRYTEFISDCKEKFPNIQMRAVRARGDNFRYRDGRIS